MNLGRKTSQEQLPSTASKSPKVSYPTVTIEKPVGAYKYGDTFTANVKFRVMKVEHGKSYQSDPARHRCTLEIISIDPAKGKGKGLPY